MDKKISTELKDYKKNMIFCINKLVNWNGNLLRFLMEERL